MFLSQFKYDGLTEYIKKLLERIPRAGKYLIRLYLWKYMMFNFMLIGASGTLLSFFLYEVVLRPRFVFWGGSFFAFILVTLIVFGWNYFWNHMFSLSMEAQVASMNKQELLALKRKVEEALSQRFTAKGDRIRE